MTKRATVATFTPSTVVDQRAIAATRTLRKLARTSPTAFVVLETFIAALDEAVKKGGDLTLTSASSPAEIRAAIFAPLATHLQRQLRVDRRANLTEGGA